MNGMKNKLYAIGVTILMMTSCTQDELISSDNGREPVTAGSCLTLVGLSSPQTRVSIGDKTGDVYPVLWSRVMPWEFSPVRQGLIFTMCSLY